MIEGWTENPINSVGKIPEELKQDFYRQLLAFESLILDYELLQNANEKR